MHTKYHVLNKITVEKEKADSPILPLDPWSAYYAAYYQYYNSYYTAQMISQGALPACGPPMNGCGSCSTGKNNKKDGKC